jgi:hypothetical protein
MIRGAFGSSRLLLCCQEGRAHRLCTQLAAGPEGTTDCGHKSDVFASSRNGPNNGGDRWKSRGMFQ